MVALYSSPNSFAPVASVTIKDIPDELLMRLRTRAAADKRSMNKEIVHLLDLALTNGVASEAAHRREIAIAQADAWTRLAGRWESDLEADDEIRAIYSARTGGRDVHL